MFTLLLEKRKTNRLSLDVAILLIALFWISRGKYLIAALLVVVAMVGIYINRKKSVVVTREYVVYPLITDQKIEWSEIHNMLLKDGILTIDLKNNKLLQSALHPSGITPDEDAFNDFCKEQLLKASEQPLLNENK